MATAKSLNECLTFKAGFYSLLALVVALVGAAIALESRFNSTVSRSEFERFTREQFQPFAENTTRELAMIRERLVALEQRGDAIHVEGGDGGHAFILVRVRTADELREESIRQLVTGEHHAVLQSE